MGEAYEAPRGGLGRLPATGPVARTNEHFADGSQRRPFAQGVDDDTWLHHLRRGDYSRWIRDSLGDNELADEITAVEERDSDDARRTREQITHLIGERYTLPAEPTDYDPDHP